MEDPVGDRERARRARAGERVVHVEQALSVIVREGLAAVGDGDLAPGWDGRDGDQVCERGKVASAQSSSRSFRRSGYHPSPHMKRARDRRTGLTAGALVFLCFVLPREHG